MTHLRSRTLFPAGLLLVLSACATPRPEHAALTVRQALAAHGGPAVPQRGDGFAPIHHLGPVAPPGGASHEGDRALLAAVRSAPQEPVREKAAQPAPEPVVAPVQVQVPAPAPRMDGEPRGQMNGGSGGLSATDLAKLAQNPLADIGRFTLDGHFGVDSGEDDGLQSRGEIRIDAPLHLSDSFNMIFRGMLPVEYRPNPLRGMRDQFGLGDATLTAWLAPAEQDEGLFFGAGPVAVFPSSTENTLGIGEWALGASAVAVFLSGPWVAGFEVNNVWSFDDNLDRMEVKPFVNYNFDDGWYLVSAPRAVFDWEQDKAERFTVPVGGGFGKVIKFGPHAVNFSLQSYVNVTHPHVGPEWSAEALFEVLF